MSLFGKREKPPFWTQKTHFFDDDEFICSVCGYKADRAYKTCPGCGTQINKVKYDPSWVDEAEMTEMMLDDD